jgi:hypothetical protein
MVFTQIHLRYELDNPPLIVEPHDLLEGSVIVTNYGINDQKLKAVFIDCVESYDDKYGENSYKNVLQTYHLSTKGVIHAEEEQQYSFKIMLPKWKRKKSRKYVGWHIALHFKQKTKLIASRGSNKLDATCFLPVKGTRVTPSFGDVRVVKK